MDAAKNIKSFYIESLGCAKNTVDSHSMVKILESYGLQHSMDSQNSDVIIVNTCGFIQPAKEESIQVLREFSEKKRKNQFLVAAGCMSEREKTHLSELVDGLDAAISTRRWGEIIKVIRRLDRNPASPYFYFPETESILSGPKEIPRYAVQGKSAYLKIADGCDRGCAYCAIPLIKGPMVSRPIRDIIKDALQLEKMGVFEIILIAQDSTAYGRDIGLEDGLPDLLSSLVNAVHSIPWIRIMYTFPGSISDKLIESMRENAQILPYLDIPLQHAHPNVLKRMRRPSNMEKVKRTIQKMRTAMPNLALRTTFIVGFPGESQQEYQELINFIKEIEFDHVGIFPYYHEAGTHAFQMKDDISEEMKNERIQNLARVQEEISLKKNQTFIGQDMPIIIEGNGDGISVGRSYRDAPEIDGMVFVQGTIEPGKLVNVHITGALTHDLIAITK
ncbi:MAG: 30S ribosomal protein S12 methylthiotransferase RimO [Anaerolineaceae bacterium]|nr:30S ribosomal protein S12 methylthiotransferase RimO [Anaerolineaceae bacterium]